LILFQFFLSLQNAFLQTFLLEVLFQRLVEHFDGGGHSLELFFAHYGLESAFEMIYFGGEYFFLSAEDGHVFIVEAHIVAFHEGLKFVLLLLFVL